MSTESEFKIDYINKNFMDGLKRKNQNGEVYYTKKGIKKLVLLHTNFTSYHAS